VLYFLNARFGLLAKEKSYLAGFHEKVGLKPKRLKRLLIRMACIKSIEAE
jgi:hypothetical protein